MGGRGGEEEEEEEEGLVGDRDWLEDNELEGLDVRELAKN